jgi:hypothetical protein
MAITSRGLAHDIANWLITDGTRSTASGNYVTSFSEIAEGFGADESLVAEAAEDILTLVSQNESVADAEIGSECFDISYYLDYCRDLEPKYATRITAGNIRIDPELIEHEDHVNAYIEMWFDVDGYFGTDTAESDEYINLYADYYPDGERLDVYYFIHRNIGADTGPIQWRLAREEQAAVLQGMKDAGLDEMLGEIADDQPGRTNTTETTRREIECQIML